MGPKFKQPKKKTRIKLVLEFEPYTPNQADYFDEEHPEPLSLEEMAAIDAENLLRKPDDFLGYGYTTRYVIVE